MSKAYKARRTALYVPAANSRALEKARTLDADVVILDLEDAVAADDKARARETAAAALKGFAPREVVVRVNSAATTWHDADVAAMAQAQPHAILLPKISGAQDSSLTSKANLGTALLVLDATTGKPLVNPATKKPTGETYPLTNSSMAYAVQLVVNTLQGMGYKVAP